MLFIEVQAISDAADSSSALRGYQALRTHEYLPPDFDDEVVADLWTTWPEPERTAAELADRTTRRQMIFSYYGLIPDPDDRDGTKPAIGYVADGRGNWVMNCLACHGGKVAGKVIPGLPNSHSSMQSLTEDVRTIKLKQGKALSHMDIGSIQMPLSTSNGDNKRGCVRNRAGSVSKTRHDGGPESAAASAAAS